MTERVAAWQCIGCGRVEAEQPCIGVCRDRRVEFVYATDHDETIAQLALARQHIAVLSALTRELASITPREGQWEQSYRVLQDRARQALNALAKDRSAIDAPQPLKTAASG
jgi:hypothetical protein